MLGCSISKYIHTYILTQRKYFLMHGIIILLFCAFFVTCLEFLHFASVSLVLFFFTFWNIYVHKTMVISVHLYSQKVLNIYLHGSSR